MTDQRDDIDARLSALGFPTAGFARGFGVNRETVRRWQDGRVRPPQYALAHLDVLDALARLDPEHPLLDRYRDTRGRPKKSAA